jgi:hypothetical protein
MMNAAHAIGRGDQLTDWPAAIQGLADDPDEEIEAFLRRATASGCFCPL